MIHVERWPIDLQPVMVFAAAGICAAGLVWVLFPLLVRYALARPNARSSHRQPTPQGGGIAVIAATVIVMAVVAAMSLRSVNDPSALALVFASTIALAIVGAVDDLRPIEALLRLALQTLAVLIVIVALPSALRILPFLPWGVERALIFIAILWWVNAVNFMDGIDWMTVAEIVPVTAGLALFGLMGALPREATLVALALCGATLGFAPFNRPVARLFLGDVGSLPIGLLTGWLLVLLAANGHLAAALLLPLYYLGDATITLIRRIMRREPILQAHRGHYYQKAFDGGVPVLRVVTRVFILNIALLVLAAATLLSPGWPIQGLALAVGCALTAALLRSFAGK